MPVGRKPIIKMSKGFEGSVGSHGSSYQAKVVAREGIIDSGKKVIAEPSVLDLLKTTNPTKPMIKSEDRVLAKINLRRVFGLDLDRMPNLKFEQDSDVLGIILVVLESTNNVEYRRIKNIVSKNFDAQKDPRNFKRALRKSVQEYINKQGGRL